MIVVNPQWQGIGRKTPIPDGTKVIQNILSGFEYEHIPCNDSELSLEDNVKGLSPIQSITEDIFKILDHKKPQKIFTCGGDCSSDYAQISYLNDLYNGDFALLWVDAHADLNTPESSPSKNFHGMTLRSLTGNGPKAMTDMNRKAIEPAQITFSGLRSIDADETRYLEENKVQRFSVQETLKGDLKNSKLTSRNLYLHVDIDCLDQSVFDHCATPTSGGFKRETLIENLNFFNNHYNIIGGCLTEYAPNTENAYFDLVESILIDGFQLKCMSF